MARVHFLNVKEGDCTIIQHVSGRATMVDICCGNYIEEPRRGLAIDETAVSIRGNFRMCEHPTNPVQYARQIGIERFWRFVLTHPDMDHMDGLDTLFREIGFDNFWETGVRREEPDFSERGCYRREDWDRYTRLCNGVGVTTLHNLAGSRFRFANKLEDGSGGGDGLYILAPDSSLVTEASRSDDVNDGSYVLLYRSAGGRVLIPGDAHDATWEYVLNNYEDDVMDCSVMIAPHHGRDSDRAFDFLNRVRPKLTLFGCAPCQHLGYSAWSNRGLQVVTSNQAGNIVLDVNNGSIDVYVENGRFANAFHGPHFFVRRSSSGYQLMRIRGD